MTDEMFRTCAREIDEEFLRLLEATDREHPQEGDVTALHTLLCEHPWLVTAQGSMIEQLANRLLRSLTENSGEGTKAFVKANLDGVRNDAGWNSASPLERLLIDAICLTWLQYYEAQRRFTNAAFINGGDLASIFWEKRVNAAHKRYLSAIEALTRIRRLAVATPAVLNVANQMVVNTAKGG